MGVGISLFAGAGGQFFDNNGDPLVGGKIYTYQAGTLTPLTTYQTYLGSSGASNSNPIILDSAGRLPYQIWLTDGVNYKFILKTSAEVTLRTEDYIQGSSSGVLVDDHTATGDSSTVAFAVSFEPSLIHIGGVYQNRSTWSYSGGNVTFTEAPPLNAPIEFLR